MSRGRADLHIHSDAGDGLSSVEQILSFATEVARLDVIAITDHDEIRGALAARDLASSSRYPCDVIVGTEISTRGGHLLAYDIDRVFRPYRPLDETIAAVHDAGGFVVVPHPLSWLTHSAGSRTLRRLVDARSGHTRPDAIEAFNPSLSGRVRHRAARELNRTLLGLVETGGSDAHHVALVGSGYTSFEGASAQDLRAAIRTGTVTWDGTWWTARDHARDLWRQQWRSMVRLPAQRVERAFTRAYR
ncbi:MAG: phosphotransferase [Chloroflexi bacterium]|nr:phosphotransferase [Chloroflexota bacterium]